PLYIVPPPVPTLFPYTTLFRSLLHYSSVARVEALALAAAHELIDAFLRELQNELALRRHHREDLAIHLEGAGAEALPVLPADVSVLGEGFHNRHKPRIDFGRVLLLRLFRSHALLCDPWSILFTF